MVDAKTKINNTGYIGKVITEDDIVNDYATAKSVNASNLYYAVGQTIADELDSKSGAIIGSLLDYPISTLSGWILCNSTKSIGDASSNATEAGAAYQTLFELLWNIAKVSVSSGTDGYILLDSSGNPTTKLGTATLDWDAHKQIELNLAGLMRVCHKTSDGDFGTSGATGGAKTHTLVISETPAHFHLIKEGGVGGGSLFFKGYVGGVVTDDPNGGSSKVPTQASGSDGSHNNLQPFIVAYTFIKY